MLGTFKNWLQKYNSLFRKRLQMRVALKIKGLPLKKEGSTI
jgi:hypothetical protein